VLVEKIGSRDMSFMASLSSLDPSDRASAVDEHFNSTINRTFTFEFSRDRKLMSVLARRNKASPSSGYLFVKGAPEVVLERCTSAMLGSSKTPIPMTSALRTELLQSTLEYGQEGLRTLALAYADVMTTDPEHYQCDSAADYDRFERDLTFVSLVGMRDPPRPEAREAVENCRAAGVRVICITGDNKGTAETICRHIGIFGKAEDLTGKSYTGREFDALTPREKLEAVQHASLFTRTEPSHKSQLVDLLQSVGLVVAMTGGLFFPEELCSACA
jgi:Ca2+ transporting ATPase